MTLGHAAVVHQPRRSFVSGFGDDAHGTLNKKSLPDLAVKQGPKGGWEFAKLSFPVLAFGPPPQRGCQLPDAILHGKRSLRPRSRAVQRLPAAGLLSEAFQLARTDGCATGLRTR